MDGDLCLVQKATPSHNLSRFTCPVCPTAPAHLQHCPQPQRQVAALRYAGGCTQRARRDGHLRSAGAAVEAVVVMDTRRMSRGRGGRGGGGQARRDEPRRTDPIARVGRHVTSRRRSAGERRAARDEQKLPSCRAARDAGKGGAESHHRPQTRRSATATWHS